MICHLHGNILNNIAVKLLTVFPQSERNWFADIRDICLMYDLINPYPPEEAVSKDAFKNLCQIN